MRRRRNIDVPQVAALAAAMCAAATAACAGDTGWSTSADYTLDVSGPIQGGAAKAGRALDNLNIAIDGDFGRPFGLTAATAHITLLNNSGGQPNAIAGTLQGVDNIEVARPRGKIYEAWVEGAGTTVSLRAGLYDLNSEFYTTDAASLLIAPAFGIGSELAATGPNGPSIFPSTALAVRLQWRPTPDSYVQGALLNAKAGVLGDPGGVDLRLQDGALSIVETGWVARGKVAAGAWRYSRRQPSFTDPAAAESTAHGVYLLVEQPVTSGPVRKASVFMRLGASDGETTPFTGGGQVGVRIDHVWSSRPGSTFSAGFNRAVLSNDFRDVTTAAGVRASKAESSVELTYQDQLNDRIALQPSVQLVQDAGGDAAAADAVILTLRAHVRLK